MDDKQRIAMVDTRTVDPAEQRPEAPMQLIRYQFGNHLGSASLELDVEAKIISYEEYYPYGSTSYQAVRRTDVEVPLKRYRYTGKERDEETGLDYHGARYYAPWLGRWVSPDPGGIEESVNLFRYVSNNTFRFRDTGGKSEEDTVKWEIMSDFEKKKIPYTTELEFYLLDEKGGRIINPETGKPLIQRMDLAYADPDTGEIGFLETKGRSKSSRTPGQKISHPRLEKGATWEIKGHKGGNIGISPGVKGGGAKSNFKIFHMENLTEFKTAFGHISEVKRFSYVQVTAEGKRDAKYFESFAEY